MSSQPLPRFRTEVLQKNLAYARRLVSDHPEIAWLAEPGTVGSPEGVAASAEPGMFQDWLYQTGDIVTEASRTIVACQSFDTVLSGGYAALTYDQPSAVRLQPATFDRLRHDTVQLLPDYPAKLAMRTSLATNDIGKAYRTKRLLELKPDMTGRPYYRNSSTQDILLSPHTIRSFDDLSPSADAEFLEDHDEIAVRAIELYPDYPLSWQFLPATDRSLVLGSMATAFNLGQFLQAESVPASLEVLQDVAEPARQFNYYHCLYDIAGAGGKLTDVGSIILTEPLVTNFKAGIAALKDIGNTKSAGDAYLEYLTQQASKLAIAGHGRKVEVITRLSLMKRLKQPAAASDLQTVYDELPPADQQVLEEGMVVTDNDPPLLEYAPAIMANIDKQCGTSAAAQRQGTLLGLQTLAQIHAAYKRSKVPVQSNPAVVHCHDIAVAAKDARRLTAMTVIIDHYGDNLIARLEPADN